MLNIAVDPANEISLATQIERQIRLAIASGNLRPGDALPPIRQLAEYLRINRNTVAAAYKAAESTGYVRTVPGSGTFVLNREALPAPQHHALVYGLVREALDRAQTLGLSPVEFGEMCYFEGLRRNHDRLIRILFVDQDPGELHHYVAQLKEKLGLPIDGRLLENLAPTGDTDRDGLAAYDVILAPFYCVEAVRAEVGPSANVLGIGAGPSLKSLVGLATIPRDGKVAITCTEPDGVIQMKSVLDAAGIHFDQPQTTYVGAHDFVSVIEWADFVIASQGSLPAVQAVIRGALVYPYSNILDETSLGIIQNWIVQAVARRLGKERT